MKKDIRKKDTRMTRDLRAQTRKEGHEERRMYREKGGSIQGWKDTRK